MNKPKSESIPDTEVKLGTDQDSIDRMNALVQEMPPKVAKWFTGSNVMLSPDRETLTIFMGFGSDNAGISFDEKLDALGDADRFGFTLLKVVVGIQAEGYFRRIDFVPAHIRIGRLVFPMLKGNPTKQTVRRRFLRLPPEEKELIKEALEESEKQFQMHPHSRPTWVEEIEV